MKRMAKLLALAVAWSLFACAASAETPKPVRLGSVAMDIPAVMNQRLTPLTRYLANTLGTDVRLQLSPDMPSAIREVADCGVEIAYLTPVAYLKARERGGVRLVAKTVTNGKSSFQLMVVVREDSPLQEVADLRGKSFAFGDPAALLQRAVVVGSGLKLAQLGEYRFLGHYDNIVRGVMNGDFEAGILKDTMAYQWQGRGIRILYSSPDLPPYNIVTCGKIDDALFEKIRQAFLSLDKSIPGHAEIIEALDNRYDGFAATSDAEYDVVRQLIRPFAKD
ncbi:MAG: PhnD/SsuA/transferrin family substrate-binding protein [Gammaproteobacteria bacterium]|nr:PhnD/SsuA/transferrin family substrate-binding protein [Gammaproteobacteria bacterium]